MTGKTFKVRLTPFNIALLYTILGGSWIFFSDLIIAEFLADPTLLGRSKIISHWLFLVVSSQALYWLIRHRETMFERSQESLFRVNRALRFFSECNKAITWDREEPELLRKICRILVMLGGYRLAWVGLARHDRDKSIVPVAYWGRDEGYLSQLRVTWDESDTGRGPAGTAVRTGQTTAVQRIDSNPTFAPWREEALRQGFASAIALPLREGRETFGVLVILAGEPDAFNLDEISLLEELADDLSSGIATIRRQKEQDRLKEEQMLLAAVIAQEAEGVMTFDPDGTIQYVNPAWETICGVPAADLVGKGMHDLDCSRSCRELYRAMQQAVERGETVAGTFVCHRPDGSRFEIDARISPVRGHADAVVRYVAVIRDVTHEVQLEEQLRTAQKMEAIATLSGGIAHDFNNILAAIITNTELILDDLPEHGTEREHLRIVLQAGLRGKNLVKQIRAISQQPCHERQPVRVEQVVEECLLLLRPSLPAIIEIRTVVAPNLATVSADPTQLHQVILNLCTNAAEAMQNGDGLLEIRVEPFHHIAPCQKDYPGLPTGHFLCLTIRDTGHGMERAVLDRIFDPFFTTKGQGNGTGLGLSVVHSIVRNHGGTITVDSEPGRGTTFRVFLPQLEHPSRPETTTIRPPAQGGNECILLVDDEADLVFAGRKMLERLGYEVVTGSDGREAFELFIEQPERFNLVITDQAMPYMTGEMLAREILNVRADLPIILCTGRETLPDGGSSWQKIREIGIRELVAKPYEREEMTRIIRQVLDGPAPADNTSWPVS
ncbi:MAG: PAS domain S-box protein [Deltaproteobacteria bacterium]|nr:MAG: PAS domain S-box protein [Deltaproteobacteria bacterium]